MVYTICGCIGSFVACPSLYRAIVAEKLFMSELHHKADSAYTDVGFRLCIKL